MDFRNYLDWTEVSGIHLWQSSRGERYRTFAEQVSPEGLNTLIVAEFLHDNANQTLNVSHWRTYSVLEVSSDARERINLTVDALEAIGAWRTSVAVRQAKSSSPFEGLKQAANDPEALQKLLQSANPFEMLGHLQASLSQLMPHLAPPSQPAPTPEKTAAPGTETWQDVADLLQAYTTQHEQQLEADIAKHGDPRALPGYSRKQRLKELDRECQKQIQREALLDDVPLIRGLMKDLVKKLSGAKNATPQFQNKLKSARRKFLDKLKESRKLVAETPVPEMLALLQEADDFIQANPAFFTMQTAGASRLEQRLTALGEYIRRKEVGEVQFSWEKPDGFNVGWNHFDLFFSLPQGARDEAVHALLNVAERTQKQIQKRSDEWKRQLIQSFREQEGSMEEWQLEDAEAEFDDDGQVTESSILSMAEAGQIQVVCHDKKGDEVQAALFIPVDWDPEHGFCIELEVEPEPVASDGGPTTVSFSPGSIQLLEAGPATSAAALDELEQKYHIQLPAEYRSFLLQSNGGIPSPNHLALQVHGDLLPYDAECFFSLVPQDHPELVPAGRSLEEILKAAWREKIPRILLPIARVKSYSHMTASTEDYLYFVLAGKKAAQVVLFDDDPLRTLSDLRNFDAQVQARAFEEHVESSRTVGKTLTAFFKKLQPLPQIELPNWLRMIQEDDRAGFLACLNAGGSLKQKYQGYGEFAPSSMIDLLTRDASPALLRELLDRGVLKPKQIRESWQTRYRYDVARFRKLMPLLPKDQWPFVLCSPAVWDHFDVLEELAAMGFDFNTAVSEEGAPPIHLAVSSGRKEAVQWLMDHGADPHKTDDYQRDAFTWAENGPGFDCLSTLKRLPTPTEAVSPPAQDSPGMAALANAATQLSPECGLRISIEIKSPPVTRIEKVYYQECHYTLMLEVGQKQVTFKDVRSPRQDYLYAGDWPEPLFAPILQWPELTPLWETLKVEEFDRAQALRKRNYQPTPRPDLLEAASGALEQGFNQEEANNRGVRLRKI